MIKLTREECLNYNFCPINYDSKESEERTKNIDKLYDLIAIIKSPSSINCLKSNTSDYKIIKFYKDYCSSDISPVKFVNREYDDFIKKVQSFSEKWNYNFEFIYNTILEDESFMINFAKDPGKQTFHQHYVAEWISNLPFVEDFKELPSGGKNALYVMDGKIVSGKDCKIKPIVKSIDFEWKYSLKDKFIRFYVAHKHTKENGGAQDNQYNDVKEFLKEACECEDISLYFLSITDGEYYEQKDGNVKNANVSRLQNLKKSYNSKHCLSTNSNNLPVDLIKIIENWIKETYPQQDVMIFNEIEKFNILQTKFTTS